MAPSPEDGAAGATSAYEKPFWNCSGQIRQPRVEITGPQSRELDQLGFHICLFRLQAASSRGPGHGHSYGGERPSCGQRTGV